MSDNYANLAPAAALINYLSPACNNTFDEDKLKKMKKLILILFSCATLDSSAQNNQTRKVTQDYNLFISGGIHAGIWSVMGLQELPYTLQVDKLLGRNFMLGAGYSYDHYTHNIFSGNTPSVRQNVRLRFLWCLNDPENNFSSYIGFSTGLSSWKIDVDHDNNYYYQPNFSVPTVQFVYGMRVKLNDTAFWLTEFGVGAPYMAQTSIGFKF